MKFMNDIRMAVMDGCEWPSPVTELSARESRMALTDHSVTIHLQSFVSDHLATISNIQ